MKAIMVMFDSLNRHMLEPYGCDWVQTPNFSRLARRGVTFENSYVGSMPCMPARRELHTGRLNFLHRSWGPLEPFDDSMPLILRQAGVHAHLATDHYHYFEDGGCTYHTQYESWEFSRGQEGDPWKGVVAEPDMPETVDGRRDRMFKQDWKNRAYMQEIEQQPQAKTFAMGLEYLRTNHAEDNWFLQLETFDPHEPYFTHRKYKDLYPHAYSGRHFDWPEYKEVAETDEEIRHVRFENAALVSMCDEHLGKVLDAMDAYDLWKDTLLIVNTDHGFLLSEHGWWGKCRMPFYNEIAHTPLFIWDPRSAVQGERRRSLVQTIDLAPTLLEYFGLERPRDMQGHVLRETIATDAPVREACLYGQFGAHVNVTDGRYAYMRAPKGKENGPLYEYTHMPTRMRGMFELEQLALTEIQEPFSFTKDCRVMKIPDKTAKGWVEPHNFGTLLFDLETDPGQERPLDDPTVEARMVEHLVRLMRANDAPPEQFERLGLTDHGA